MAVDPGNHKCGVAVVDGYKVVLAKNVVPINKLAQTATAFKEQFSLGLIVVGDRTNSKAIREVLASLNLPIKLVNEDNSSVEGRYRYLKENTTGLARLLPIGLRYPKQPYDDYVAVILAERFLEQNRDSIN